MVEEWKPLNPPAPPEPATTAAPAGPHKWRQSFRGLPVRTPEGPGPFSIPTELADDIATHVEALGFVSYEDLVAAIGVEGVEDLGLPRPTRHQEPPEHGPDTWMNPPRWVDKEETA